MRAPATGSGITKPWVEYILKKHEATMQLKVHTLNISKDLGEGFNSELVFFTAETTKTEEGDSTDSQDKVYHLVAKFLSQDPANHVINEKQKSHLKEFLIYTEIIEEFNKLQAAKLPSEPQVTIPKLFYGKCTNKEFVLVMENLQHAEYKTNDKHLGLDFHHLKAAVDRLARLHALSYVYSQSTNFQEKYPCIPNTSDYVQMFGQLTMIMLENCISFLKSSSETEDLGNKMNACKTVLAEKQSSAISHTKDSIACLVHGDFWNGNIMFKHATASEQSQQVIEDIKIIDWGCSSWGFPLFDLQYLVHTSTTRAVRTAHLEEVLQHYHSTFIRIASPPHNWGFEQFMADWEKTYVIGFLTGCALTQGTLSTSNPMSAKPQPSALDKPFLAPLKMVVDGIKFGLAKVIMPLAFSSGGINLLKGLFHKMFKPILEELMSGENEVMNTRLLDLVHEADEKGLFTI